MTLVEVYLEGSTKEQRTIAETTGRMLKEASVAQEYHVTVINELTGKVGLKSAKFPKVFDGPSVWSTIESLGHYALSIKLEIPRVVSESVLANQRTLVDTALSGFQNTFVPSSDWNELLVNFGTYVKKEIEDKAKYNQVISSCQTRLDVLEKLANPGFVPIPSPRTAYDPFQNTVP